MPSTSAPTGEFIFTSYNTIDGSIYTVDRSFPIDLIRAIPAEIT